MAQEAAPSPFSDYKQSVRVASTVNIDLESAPPVIDGIAIGYGDKFLAKDQDDAKDNGLYVYRNNENVAVHAEGGRGGQLTSGALIIIEEGDDNADKIFMLTTDGPITVSETPLTFEEFAPTVVPPPAVDLLPLNNTWTGLNTHTGDINLLDGFDVILGTGASGPNNSNELRWRNGVGLINTSGSILTVNNGSLQSGGFELLGSSSLSRTSASSASTELLYSRVSGDNEDRLSIKADGKLEWGSGTAVADVNLYRLSSTTLKTDDTLEAGNGLSTTGGSIVAFGGGGFQDRTGSGFNARGAVSNLAFSSNTASDGNKRFQMEVSGKMEWSDGTASPDTNLYRSAAYSLTTDGGLGVHGVTPPAQAAPIAAPTDLATAIVAIDELRAALENVGIIGLAAVPGIDTVDWTSDTLTVTGSGFTGLSAIIMNDDPLGPWSVIGNAAVLGLGAAGDAQTWTDTTIVCAYPPHADRISVADPVTKIAIWDPTASFEVYVWTGSLSTP